ncbi:hypothetical protein C6B38_04830 [Spiroplasma sp. ChiS]|uniref:lipoprotein n=1 Tax=Spiroplasma sp. ChiS TaxID=2099885 RepID=UPI000CF8C6D7|nr:lipoprotein [Spiroplasma sp. ChiS]PQP78637.1 hypothetical protein C6B38_04830 [Spiroplasma sp. ChiS]
MKKRLSFLGAITLLGTSTTSLVACNNIPQYNEDELQQLKQKNQIYTNCKEIKENLEWICPQEKPFNEIDNKYYFIIWRGLKLDEWIVKKYKNFGLDRSNTLIDKSKSNAELHRVSHDLHTIANKEYSAWSKDNGTYFKAVYRWNLDTNEPNLIIDDNGNVKVNGE